jgi:hypothetical protein
MTDISYRVVPRGKSGFDVEMDMSDGRKRTVPGFRSEHEADAWIVQAKRMIRDAGPWTPLAPRKPVPAATGEVPKSLPPGTTPAAHVAPAQKSAALTQAALADGASGDSKPNAPDSGNRAAAPRVRVRTVRERSAAQG